MLMALAKHNKDNVIKKLSETIDKKQYICDKEELHKILKKISERGNKTK